MVNINNTGGNLKEKVIFRNFNWQKDIALVCEWHKDMVKIDFPDSAYIEDLFKGIVKKEYEQEPEGLFILEIDKKPIGFLWLNTRHDPYRSKNYGYVHYVYIAQAYRKQGIGKKMMEKTDDYFFNIKKVDTIQLGTHADNISRKLYESSGYKLKRVILEKTKNSGSTNTN